MNTLEFIEREIGIIESEKKRYLIIESEKKRYLTKFRYEPNDVYFNNFIESLEKKIDYLQQIKVELEAWEIAKAKEVDILDVKTSLDLETFNLDLVKTYQLTDYEYKTLKKALEVE